MTSAASLRHSRHCLDFDQELITYQTVDHEQGVGRIVAAGENVREDLVSSVDEAFHRVAPHHIGREFHHVVEPGAGRLQNTANVLEDLARLGRGIARPYEGARKVHTNLSGYKYKLPGIHRHSYRIGTEGLGGPVAGYRCPL